MKVLRNAKFTGNIKINDTNTNIYFQAYDDGILQKLDAGKCSFRIKNDTGYLITISNVSTETDYITFKSNELKPLPVGTYYLELWVEDDTGTCIYPDENFCKLRINENVTVAQGSTIPTISLEEYENKLQGYVDNAVSDGTQKIESDFDKYVDSITDSTIANANNAIKATKASPVNYVPNSDFKTDLNDFYSITSSDGNVQVIEQGFGFENSLKISIGGQTQNKYFGIKLKDWMSVQPNTVISLGAMFKGSDLDAKAKMEINVYNSDRAKVGSTGVYGDNNSTFEKGMLKLENFTIPADGSLLEIKFFVIKNGTIEIAHPMLVQGASLPNAWYDDDLSELKIANTAKSNADTAESIANTAKSVAESANQIASNAQTVANEAKSTADAANNKATDNASLISSLNSVVTPFTNQDLIALCKVDSDKYSDFNRVPDGTYHLNGWDTSGLSLMTNIPSIVKEGYFVYQHLNMLGKILQILFDQSANIYIQVLSLDASNIDVPWRKFTGTQV